MNTVTHRDLCRSVAKWMLNQYAIQLVSWELGLDVGVVDAIGITTKLVKFKNPRIIITEVKRTRKDLLQDLKRKKMLNYEPRATHCYLALTPEAAFTKKDLTTYNSYKDRDKLIKELLADLTAKGLPSYWGVLIAVEGKEIYWECIRKARRTQSNITKSSLEAIIKKIALSYMYRVFSPTSPMTDGHRVIKPTKIKRRKRIR